MQRRAKAWIFAALAVWGVEATCFAAPKAPSTVDRLVQEGRWTEAREALARDAKKGSTAARKRARARIDALTKKMPRLVVRMPRDVQARVTVDGWPVAPADETTLRVDPGEHVIEVDGRRERIALEAGTKHVFVVEAATPTPNISVRSAASAARSTDMSTGPEGTLVSSTSTPTSTSTSTSTPTPTPTPSPMRTVAWIGLGVGGAAIAGGAIFAATAAHERDVLSVRCPNDRCGERDREAWEAGKAHANLATVLLGAGAAVTATSIAILVFAPSSQEKIALRASASQLSIAGTFR